MNLFPSMTFDMHLSCQITCEENIGNRFHLTEAKWTLVIIRIAQAV